MRIKKGDTVIVISGDDKGKKGRVRYVNREKKRVIVEGVAMVRKHTKPTRMGEVGGIVEKEAEIPVSKVLLICPRCGQPTRTGRMKLEGGKSVRYCKKCKEVID